MLKYGSWDLPGLDYFQFKNTFKGSREDFRFAVTGSDDIKVLSWRGNVCLELAEDIEEKHFELNEKSLYDINQYLSDEFKREV